MIANRGRVGRLHEGRRRRGHRRHRRRGRPAASTSAAAVVVNAAGVWADERPRAGRRSAIPTRIRPAKGVHITVPWQKVRNDIAVVIPVPGDKRSLFVVPWGERPDGTFEHTYVGTTDTDYDGPLDDPPCTADDIAYVLRALNHAVTTDDHHRGRHRRVGRPATTGQVGDRVVAPPTCRAATGSRRDRPASSPSPAAS